MKTYTFKSKNESFSAEASTYEEALAALVFEVGSEADASDWIFEGANE